MEKYKEMYLTMMRASEQAIRELAAAQRRCEELYLQAGDAKAELLSKKETEDRT